VRDPYAIYAHDAHVHDAHDTRTTVHKHFGNRLEVLHRGFPAVISGDLTMTIEQARGLTIRQPRMFGSPGLLSASWSDVERGHGRGVRDLRARQPSSWLMSRSAPVRF
jgi:hypothetical protein